MPYLRLRAKYVAISVNHYKDSFSAKVYSQRDMLLLTLSHTTPLR